MEGLGAEEVRKVVDGYGQWSCLLIENQLRREIILMEKEQGLDKTREMSRKSKTTEDDLYCGGEDIQNRDTTKS